MVDYSKWDKLEVCDSEEEDVRGRPHVTRFDTASSVTVTPEGLAVTESPPTAVEAAVEPAAAPAAAHGAGGERAGAGADPGGVWVRNGYEEATHFFSQTKEEVTVCVFVAAGTRAKQVGVRLTAENALEVSVGGGVAFSGKLHGGVVNALVEAAPSLAAPGSDADDSDDDDIDWEVLDAPSGSPPAAAGSRMVRVTLRKRPAVPGTVHWWQQAFQADACRVALDDLQDRRPGARKTMQEVWDAAHKEFRRKTAERLAAGPVEV